MKVRVDNEFNVETFWEAFWEAFPDKSPEEEFEFSDTEWEEIKTLPGFNEGPPWAPNPFLVEGE